MLARGAVFERLEDLWIRDGKSPLGREQDAMAEKGSECRSLELEILMERMPDE